MNRNVTADELGEWSRKAGEWKDLVKRTQRLYEQGKIKALTYEKVLDMSTRFGIELLKKLS